MDNGMLKDLLQQLSAEGIESPEALPVSEPTELSESHWGAVSGGFGQVVGFGQAFDQSSGPGGFRLTHFAQNI